MVVMGAEKAKQVPITSKEADFVILDSLGLELTLARWDLPAEDEEGVGCVSRGCCRIGLETL